MPQPVIVTTWPFGKDAAFEGGRILLSGASALDAVEAAANVTENDPEVNSVGYGGLPNAAGEVELDAAIMDGPSHGAGAVGGLTRTARPISVARRVMEVTPHVFLVGDRARDFARQQGYEDFDLLTDAACRRWMEWKALQSGAEVAHFPSASRVDEFDDKRVYTPDNHDTIGLCALDVYGNLAAGCTTSGMAWKIPGRVGDSPIIGSGLYVDNEIGAAAGTGHGDEMMKALLSYRAVMNMESGQTPEAACVEALRYLLTKRPPENHGHYGAALIAIRKDGIFGGASTVSGFHKPDRLWIWAHSHGEQVSMHEGVYVTPSSVSPTL